jgi:hypothetical protein
MKKMLESLIDYILRGMEWRAVETRCIASLQTGTRLGEGSAFVAVKASVHACRSEMQGTGCKAGALLLTRRRLEPSPSAVETGRAPSVQAGTRLGGGSKKTMKSPKGVNFILLSKLKILIA